MKYEILSKAVQACIVAKIKSDEQAEGYKKIGRPDIALIFEKDSREFEQCMNDINKELSKGNFDE